MKIDNINNYIIDLEISKKLGIDKLLKYNIFPIREYEIYVLVACVYEIQEKQIIYKLFNKPVKFIIIPKKIFNFEITHFDLKYEIFSLAKQSLVLDDENNENISSISKLSDKLFKFAIDMKASDIHIETTQDSLVVRFRIDGILIQFFKLCYKLYYIISSIIKLFASLDISQKRLPQNGRFSKNISNADFDFRVSILPIINGESIVIRILDNQKAFIKLKDIGFSDDVYDKIRRNILYTQGMILITGPTGSGKTTTLYSILNQLNNQKRKIITIEDPIEYNIDGISQVNINSDIGLDYEIVLKNILRQDPDILMIGEIRDVKTLQVAIQASLTGHLVIATLHTNDAIKTINRLLDLKAEPFLIASTLRLIVSQRLIRVLCNSCKKEVVVNGIKTYQAVGCVKCNLAGYKDRTIITESLQIDEKISQMINNKTDISNIIEYASYATINDNSYQKVLDGITSLEEYYSHEI